MFMLYPESFERVVSLKDKKLICRDLACTTNAIALENFLSSGGYNSQIAVDRLLLEIREALEAKISQPVDFYFNAEVNALWGENDNLPAPSNKLIHETIKAINSDDPDAPSYDLTSTNPEIDPVLEGKPVLRQHYSRERDHTLRQRKIDEQLKIHGEISCECCGDNGARFANTKLRIFEIHHQIPLSQYRGTKITDLSEVSVLCANCHRAVHATNPPTPVNELRNQLTP